MSGADEYTPAETGRAFVDIKATLGQVLDELKDMRRDNAAQFLALEDKYVLQQVWSATLQNLHDRQDDYQTQTDRLILGADSEVQLVRRSLADLDAMVTANHRAALQEIKDAEDRRQVELEKVQSQRHNDRVAYTIAFLALLGGLLAALLPGWMS